MNKFQRGKIYTIRSHKTPLIYVGSTCQRHLSSRMTGHRSAFKAYKNGKGSYLNSFDIFEVDENCYIELYEYYPCNTDLELRKREGEVIRELDCVNKHIAGRTKKEWDEENKEKRREWAKEYYEDNKEQIKAKSKQYRERNKDKLKAKKKQYRANNKERINAKKKEKFECECGSIYTHGHKARHMKSKKHQEYMDFMYN